MQSTACKTIAGPSAATCRGAMVPRCSGALARAAPLAQRSAFAGSVASLKRGQGNTLRASRTNVTAVRAAASIYDFTVTNIDGRKIPMSDFKGKVLLVVNVASQCGMTPQYKGLQELFGKFEKQGFSLVAFPCNQFGGQEPGTNADIKAFASRQGAKFPMMSKVDVNGPSADPVWNFMKDKQGGLLTKDIKWNFTKFLVDRSGNVVKRYGSTTTPEEIEKDIASLL